MVFQELELNTVFEDKEILLSGKNFKSWLVSQVQPRLAIFEVTANKEKP